MFVLKIAGIILWICGFGLIWMGKYVGLGCIGLLIGTFYLLADFYLGKEIENKKSKKTNPTAANGSCENPAHQRRSADNY